VKSEQMRLLVIFAIAAPARNSCLTHNWKPISMRCLASVGSAALIHHYSRGCPQYGPLLMREGTGAGMEIMVNAGKCNHTMQH
jgi:hypothetical protein